MLRTRRWTLHKSQRRQIHRALAEPQQSPSTETRALKQSLKQSLNRELHVTSADLNEVRLRSSERVVGEQRVQLPVDVSEFVRLHQ
jgi:hypothetical protein